MSSSPYQADQSQQRMKTGVSIWAFLVIFNIDVWSCPIMAAKAEVVHVDDKNENFKRLKLVVFGATGATGTALVNQGLELGHEITAIVRTPENFKLK